MRSRWLLLLPALMTASTVGPQAMAQSEIDYFAGDYSALEADQGGRRVIVNDRSAPREPAPEFSQTLYFQDGRQLRGTLAEVTPEEVHWRRKDIAEPLRFPRAEVRRILLIPQERLPNPFFFSSGRSTQKPPTPLPATVKLGGGDWLRGVLTSTDGQTFALGLKGGTTCDLGRGQIDWLHFDAQPAPAFGLGDGPLGLEGWLAEGMPQVESKNGTLVLRDTKWIGHALAMPKRFEIAFEIPEESEEGLRLWIQPFTPQPNSYSTGTVQFRFGRKALKWLIFQDTTQAKEEPLLAEAQADKGPVRYRVLYDGPGDAVIVLRNGRKLGEWPLKPKDQPADQQRQQRSPRGVCFDRDDRGRSGTPLQFRRLAVLPWDGDRAAPPATASSEDRLSAPPAATIDGQLTAVKTEELVFSGQPAPLKPETLVRFPASPSALPEADALLSFGDDGELSIAGLQVSAGKIRGRTVFSAAAELPASALQSISFSAHTTAPAKAGDLLVFRNGDELPGVLVSAVTGAPLRWRLITGQEIEFQTEGVAGVRISGDGPPQPAGTVELRTGERIRGTLTALDGERLRWHHDLLGDLAIERARLWRLYPNAAQSPRSGDQDSTHWLDDALNVQRMIQYSRVRARSESWLALDGRFILRTRNNSSGEQALGPSCELDGQLDRYELQVEVVHPGVNPGNLSITFSAPENNGSVGVNVSPYQLSVYVQNPKFPNGGGGRELPVQDKLGPNARQLCLRAFVNRAAGTIDLFLNGHSFGRIGQSAAERVPGIGKTISLDAYTYAGAQLMISEVNIAPWSGELPRSGPAGPITVLANGDTAQGLPSMLAGGRCKLESEVGPLDLPADKVQAVEFGGELQPTTAAARIRLADGSALLVEHLAWSPDGLVVRHALFGELRLPPSAVRELIYQPAPVRAPTVVAKKVALENPPAKVKGE